MKRQLLLFLTFLIWLFAPLFAQDTGLEDFSLEELLNVRVVSDAQSALRIREAPSVIRVITAQEIYERGYQSIGEALKSVAGLYVAYDNYNYNVCTRGISSGMRRWNRIVKVMIDNQPVSFRYSDINFLGPELIPMEAVQRIEVVVGPGSTLYGPDAFQGVINIVTKEGDDFDGLLAAARLGSENKQDLSMGGLLTFGKKTETTNILLSVAGLNSDRSGLKMPETSPLAGLYVGQKSQDDAALPLSMYGKFSYGNTKIGTFTVNSNVQYLSNYAEFAD